MGLIYLVLFSSHGGLLYASQGLALCVFLLALAWEMRRVNLAREIPFHAITEIMPRSAPLRFVRPSFEVWHADAEGRRSRWPIELPRPAKAAEPQEFDRALRLLREAGLPVQESEGR